MLNSVFWSRCGAVNICGHHILTFSCSFTVVSQLLELLFVKLGYFYVPCLSPDEVDFYIYFISPWAAIVKKINKIKAEKYKHTKTQKQTRKSKRTNKL